MAAPPPPIPTRFPCWCRAVYSYGGESKRDLGFMEGELIECLNAGDGSWWMGRLRRDRRMVGLFPSNFVEVLPDDFRPVSRTTSPMPPPQNTPPPGTPQKSRTFRKPFEAYAKAPHYTTAKQPEVFLESPVRTRDSSRGPPRTPVPVAHNRGVHDDIARIRTPQLHGHDSRRPSPAPSFNTQLQQRHISSLDGSDDAPPPPPPHRQAVTPRHGSSLSYDSQMPPQSHVEHVSRHGSHLSYDSRIPHDYNRLASHASHDSRMMHFPDDRRGSHSPFDPRLQRDLSRQEPPRAPYEDRVEYEPYRPPASRNGYHTPRAHSPAPSHAGSGINLTPSPLREAMDGVMEQLDALGVSREPEPEPELESPEAPFDPWSPESFDLVGQRSRRKQRDARRPQTSLAILHGDSGYGTASADSLHQHPPHAATAAAAAGYEQTGRQSQLSTYLERMETRLGSSHPPQSALPIDDDVDDDDDNDGDEAPPPPPKGRAFERPKSSMDSRTDSQSRRLRSKRSGYEISKALGRTFTTKTNSTSASSKTNSSAATQSTDRSLMSGVSAGGISATSAGSMARKNRSRAQSAYGAHDLGIDRPDSPFTGISYHSSHATDALAARPKSQAGFVEDPMGALGGLASPTPKKRNFFKKLIDTAKTGVANGRGSVSTTNGTGSMQSLQSLQSSPMPPTMGSGMGSMGSLMSPGGGLFGPPINTTRDTVREMGLASGTDWVQVRRDINRSNTLSRNEKNERRDRCVMLDYPALDPVDELYGSIEGEEGVDGNPIHNPTDYQVINFANVDKNSRFIKSLPPMTTAITLATTYVCRPYRSDIQRLRAIFTWVAEVICWEEDYEGSGDVDTRHIIQHKRACAREYAVLVEEMCGAVGIHCEVVRGYLKTPGEIPETNMLPRPNHWWNAVLIDGEWRMMDCCLASPSNHKRALYSSAGSGSADFWYFLTRPTELCWTHMPEDHEQQHICPPVAPEILLNLPCACPPYFLNNIQMIDYNTSLVRIEDLEMVHIKFNVPADIEVAAEVETRALRRDMDGDFYESGDVVKKRALAQCEWFGGVKRYTVKALLPGDEGHGILKIYAGKRGLMHSLKDIPHPMAFAIPIIHTGENPVYEFVTRHPTPHAQRHDIYVAQPQCQRLALNNTFVFAVRQHPSSAPEGTAAALPSANGSASPIPFARPSSAMSISVASNPSSYSNVSGSGGPKPAKLAIQTPSGKILRLMRKEDRGRGGGVSSGGGDDETSDSGTWETIIKCSERGVWRGLVLADRIAKWCVFAEWHCE